MSAHAIFDHAPIGSTIAWSDGTPRPLARFTRKLAAWLTNNGKGRLIRKQPGRSMGNLSLSASFTLHEADFGAGGVVAIRVHRTFSLDSTLHFRWSSARRSGRCACSTGPARMPTGHRGGGGMALAARLSARRAPGGHGR